MPEVSKYGGKQYKSNYFGSHGAVADARAAYTLARVGLDISDQYVRRKKYVRTLLVSLISDLNSALMTAVKKLRFISALLYLREVRKMVGVLRNEYGYHGLASTDLDVVFATLTQVWFFPPKWARRDAIVIGRASIAHPQATVAIQMLGMARMSRLTSVPEAERDECGYRAKQYVRNAFEHGLPKDVQWEVVARIASLTGMSEQMCEAAKRDGRPDVLLKYGDNSLKSRLVRKLKP